MVGRIASALLALLLPIMAAGQGLVGVPAADGAHGFSVDRLLTQDGRKVEPAAFGSQLVPVWASPDGRLLALVSMSRQPGAPIMPLAPLMGGGADWRVIDATSLLSGGLRWRLGNGLHADALFSTGVMASDVLANGARANGLNGTDCNGFSSYACSEVAAVGSNRSDIFSSNLGLGWTSSSGDQEYSYGLSWLRERNSPSASSINGIAGLSASPVLMTIGSYTFHSTGMGAAGRWKIGFDSAIDLGASISQGQLFPFSFSGVGSSGIGIDQTALSFGVSSGSLRGTIIGRSVSSPDAFLAGKRWTLLDIGVSWRTPWRGELSVGTQSFIAPVSDAGDADVSQTRVPYVQYRQDL
ncbi:MAG: hypothetical protein ABI451_00325 [Dokdonella sp.]